MEYKKFIDIFGFVKIENYISIETIDIINNIIDKLKENIIVSDDIFYEGNSKLIKQIQYLHKKDNILNNIMNDIVVDIVNKIYGKPIKYNILNMQLFEKYPKISKPTRSHQDNAYFKLKGNIEPITIWISLDNIDEENGCIYYLPYSHNSGTLKHNRYSKYTTFRIRSGVPGLSLCLPKSYDKQQIPIYTNKGDIVIHFSNTIHMAGANISDNRRRRAIGIVVIPDETYIDDDLMMWHKEMLKEDIELQNNKNELMNKYL